MFKQLHIKNFTLIDELDIHFDSGFSVITGETGAGKSIILGAIGLLMGNRADTKVIRAGQERCIIEAHFDISRYDHLQSFFEQYDIDYDANDCILRREINRSGKTRAFINDSPTPLAVIKELGEQLIDIHSQHQNLLLNKEDFQLHVVDIITKDENTSAEYQTAYRKYKQEAERLNLLEADIEKGHENEDFLRFQANELSRAQLIAGEQETLEQALAALEHVEEIKSALYTADNLLYSESSGILQAVKTIGQQLENTQKVYPAITELTERVNTIYIELKDIAQEISSIKEDIDFDPSKLKETQARLDTLYSLEHKFHVTTVEELIEQQKQIENTLAHIDHSEEALEQQQKLVGELLNDCTQKASKLTEIRQSAARKIEKEMQTRLVPLGIPNVRFQVQITEKPLERDGKDRIAFLFSANTASPILPVSQVASGGEIARVMLSLKAMISGTVKLPTIIFDEIDTGVSGSVAERMAKIMQDMGAGNCQVISITHLPQIAALGKNHYKVSKEETPNGTSSKMFRLDPDQRIQEIAQMLSGSNITNAALANARELLNGNK